MSVASVNAGQAIDYSQYMTGKASNNPAGIPISAHMESQVNGYNTGADNAKSGQDVIQVRDGALAGITDSLKRIRELSLQASNTAIYGDDDRQAMQAEVDQLKQQIQGSAKGTEFNTIKLADGSMADMNLATNPKGTGMKINLEDTTLTSLGIADYDLTTDFDISKIDDALAKVTSSRTDSAAESNSLSYQIDYNGIASYNLESSQSKLDDTDVEEFVSSLQKDKIMQQYQFFAQKKETNNKLSFEKMLM